MQIHQLVPALHDGDAIGDSARAMRDYLRARGYVSDIYAYNIDESIAAEALDFNATQPRSNPDDILILHFALPSGMTDFLKRSSCKKALIYHNVTPAFYWLGYDNSLLHLAYAGRKELESLSPFVDRAAGDSEYNRKEMEQLQFRSTCVLPIYVKQERYLIEPSSYVMNSLENDTFYFLFVGRVAPNKRLEDILKLLFIYKNLYHSLVRVIFVGKTDVVPSYTTALRDLRGRFGIMMDEILFTGHVDWPELVAYYKKSHVFISMSEHEGFCVPLVEAMICETPIVAYSTTAIPDTLGDAGFQFREKDFVKIAGICHKIREDTHFRNSILESQKKQLRKFGKHEIEKSINEFLSPML
jgi:L-malate glycosyltransferase